MGVPKFFRWLSERYPCLSEELREYQIPEFDNLYFDMNGIIHVCSHPNDFDPHFRISEEQIFASIFHYIEVLFRLIRPKKLFFMAVDGVAPRAKMNQQRGRRFSSAKEAETLEKKALEKGESLPKEKRFDSNCITPGTKFMAKLQEQLKYFVANKITNDKLWRIPTIILSGHSVPGEGEHKIMDYIRYLRSKPDWNPHTRHCLYGLDADLIILGLCTHEPNFSLLREEVKFSKSKTKRTATPETTNYMLLHLSLLRDYLDLEFQSLKENLPFPYDIEKVIDDWVLMGFLVGNDFIPHVPNLHIHANALAILYATYRTVLPTLDGYINENGVLNLARFEKFLIELSKFDTDTFTETYTDMKYFESKTGRKMFPDPQVQGNEEGKNKVDEDSLNALIESSALEMFDFEDEEDWLDESLEPSGLETLTTEEEADKLFNKEFKNHRRYYYINKMEYPSVNSDILKKEAAEYVKGLQWILFYYYRGCPSWDWYYPHHYSPYVSDLRGFSDMDIKFNLGTPFLPFQQLLAVLPAASREFLPEGYQSLMVAKDSPIIDYYPTEFKFDLNGKKQEWEAVVLIPFIEEKRLLEAMEPFQKQLTDEEKLRNSHGSMLVYNYSCESQGSYKAPEYFPEISPNHAKSYEIYPYELEVPLKKLVIGRHPSLQKSPLWKPGFPVLWCLKITGTLEKKNVRVFEHPSRNESMILRIQEREEMNKSLRQIALSFINRDYFYASYPHLTLAKFTEIVSKDETIELVDDSGLDERQNSSTAQVLWNKKLSYLKEQHIGKFGIDLSTCNVIVYGYPLEGITWKYLTCGKAVKNMIWGKEQIGYPLDTCVLDINQTIHLDYFNQVYDLKDVFSPGLKVFMIGPLDYGARARVRKTDGDFVSVDLITTTEPDFSPVIKQIENSTSGYYYANYCASKLGISSHLFSRITSGILVQSPHTDTDRANIGLGLKFSRSNQLMIGYTRKEGHAWLYSDAAVDLVRQYMETFPDLFEYLAENIQEEMFFKDKMFPNDSSAKRLTEIKAWLKEQTKGEVRSVDGELLDPCSMTVLEKSIDEYVEVDVQLKQVTLKPHYLYIPKPDVTIAPPDPNVKHKLLDRIVFVRESHSIPLGYKGTIIGIERKVCKGISLYDDKCTEAATLYDIVFDKEVIGGQATLGITKKRLYRLTKQVFINISHGQRIEANDNRSPRNQSNSYSSKTCYNRSMNAEGGSLKQSKQFSPQQKVQHMTASESSDSRTTPVSNTLNGEQSTLVPHNPPNFGRFKKKNTSGKALYANSPLLYNQPKQHAPQTQKSPPSANVNSVQPLTENLPATQDFDSDSSNKPSGSVTNFFKAYRNHANNNTPGHSQGQDLMKSDRPGSDTNKLRSPNDAPHLKKLDDLPLPDFWNYMKNFNKRQANADVAEEGKCNVVPTSDLQLEADLSNSRHVSRGARGAARPSHSAANFNNPQPIDVANINQNFISSVTNPHHLVEGQDLRDKSEKRGADPTSNQAHHNKTQAESAEEFWEFLKKQKAQAEVGEEVKTSLVPGSEVHPKVLVPPHVARLLPPGLHFEGRGRGPPHSSTTTKDTQHQDVGNNNHNILPSVVNPHQLVEQTEALKKMLCINPSGSYNNTDNTNPKYGRELPAKGPPKDGMKVSSNYTGPSARPVCNHYPTCRDAFARLCKDLNLATPMTWFKSYENGFHGWCRFFEGLEFLCPVMPTSEEAKERLACCGCFILLEGLGPEPRTNYLENGVYPVPTSRSGYYDPPAFAKVVTWPPNFHQINQSHGETSSAPTPTERTKSTRYSKGTSASRSANVSFHNLPSGSSPNREQTRPETNTRNEGETKRRNRRMRLAAKFQTPMNP